MSSTTYQRGSTPAHFWARVDQSAGPEGCWPFLGARSPGNYGILNRRSHGEGFAHRRALSLSGVDVPRDKIVLHSCDNPPCCNPAHLSVGTNAENTRQMMERGRFPDMKGAAHPQAKLTETHVRMIRVLAGEGFPYTEIGPLFGISAQAASRVARRKLWAHLDAKAVAS